jgi:hypothetical protein
MGKSLVIVESPAKAKTINKYLGNQYVVKSSIGHIRDLPTSGSASASKEPAAKRGKAAGEAPVLAQRKGAQATGFAHGCRPGTWLESQVRDPSGQGEGHRRAAPARQGC